MLRVPVPESSESTRHTPLDLRPTVFMAKGLVGNSTAGKKPTVSRGSEFG